MKMGCFIAPSFSTLMICNPLSSKSLIEREVLTKQLSPMVLHGQDGAGEDD